MDLVHKIATFKNVLNMAVLEERLNKTHIEKMGREFWAMYQCILNKPLWSDWSGGLCSLVHGSPVHKALSSKSLNWILRQYLQSSYSLGKI